MSHLDLAQHRYLLKPEGKQKFYDNFIVLMGEHLPLLRQAFMVRLLSNAGLRKGRAYTINKLAKFAAAQEKYPDFIDAITTLIHRNVLMRGYVLKCDTCDTEDWYGFNDVHDPLICPECLTQTPLPLELEFKYRLNKIARNALNQGGLSVILTILWLKKRYGDEIPYQTSLRAQRSGEQFDIDLLVELENLRIVVECKDNFKDEDVSEITEQITNLKRLTVTDKQTKILFATLKSDIPDTITTLEDLECLTAQELID